MIGNNSPADWRPIGVADFEEAAWAAIRDTTQHQIVVAGPGAGKTELLAQRAAFLLQTGAIRGERRILALAFKRDAAATLDERVRRRCGWDLGERFTSLTIDAFAKSLVDRFGAALPSECRPRSTYELVSGTDPELLEALHRGIRVAATEASASDTVAAYARRCMSTQAFLHRVARARECWSPFAPPRRNAGTAEDKERAASAWATPFAWREALGRGLVSWDMLKRMAIRLLASNPPILCAVRQTYAHLFLDEMQDITSLQLELVHYCFPPSTALLTGVGDDRQGIMAWAGAVPEIFGWVERRYEAIRRELVRNYRAGGRLVEIQHVLMRAVSGTAPAPHVADRSRSAEGQCAVWIFPDSQREAAALADAVAFLTTRGVRAHDICILTRQKVAQFAPSLIEALASRGVAARVDEVIQEMLRDPISRACRALAVLAVRRRAPDEFGLLTYLAADHFESDRIGNVDQRVRRATRALELRLAAAGTDPLGVGAVLTEAISSLFGSVERLGARVRPPQRPHEVTRAVTAFAELLADARARSPTWSEALDHFDGIDVVPIMTVHKSKGLEYNTVIFVGLEDAAWWAFAKQPEEERRTFFVAFSRARQRVLFTFSDTRDRGAGAERQRRDQIASLYDLLTEAGVESVANPDDGVRAVFLS